MNEATCQTKHVNHSERLKAMDYPEHWSEMINFDDSSKALQIPSVTDTTRVV